jgi:hypothetical protein
MQYSIITTLLAAPLLALAQFPPPVEFSNILRSPINENITIAYKTPPAGTCTTAFSTQKQFTGYIGMLHDAKIQLLLTQPGLPPFTLQPIQQNYSINTFFWFTEARQNPETAPLTIWINGGPGSSSLIGMFAENGPCEVIQMPDGSYGTQARMWGWDRSSNILFIDQPAQVRALSIPRVVANICRNAQSSPVGCHIHRELTSTGLPVRKQYPSFSLCIATVFKMRDCRL